MTTQTGSIATLTTLLYGPYGDGAVDINDAGQVSGSSNASSGSAAATWLGSAVVALPTLSGYQYSFAESINNAGQIVGYVGNGPFDASHAVIWEKNGTASYVGNSAYYSQAYGINDLGQVVGVAGPIGQPDRAFVWQNGVMTYLPDLPGVANFDSGSYDGVALAINNSGQIAGFALALGNTDHAALWQNGTATDLGVLPGGDFSEARDINASGQIVGFSQTHMGSTAPTAAFLWQNGVMTALTLPTGWTNSDAFGINDAGLIVGSAVRPDGSSSSHTVAVLWKNGVAIDLNSMLPDSYLGDTLTWASAINNNDQIVVSDGTSDYVLTLGGGIAGLTAASAAQSFANGKITGQVPILDSAADVQAAFDALQNMAAAGQIGSITLTDQTVPILTLTAAQFEHDATALQEIQGTYDLTVTGGPVTAASILGVFGPRYSLYASDPVNPHLSPLTILDSAANIAANIFNIEGLAEAQSLTAIDLTDSGTPTLTLSAYIAPQMSKALAAISGSYQLDLTDVDPANAVQEAALPHVAAVSVAGDGVVVGLDLDKLQSLAQAGKLLAIDLQPGTSIANGDNIPGLYVTPAQLSADGAAIAKITGTYDLFIIAPAAGQTISGLTGIANAVSFSSPASQYSFTPAADGQSLIIGNNGNVYTLKGIEALQFSDNLLIVAHTPGDAAHVTTGNITELYSAVFAREPDLAGLSFYQNYLAANPHTSLLQFAQYFLASAEYSGTPAHAYAQTTAGETQFITDSYQNLLHRTPTSDEVGFYLANVLGNPGSQLQNHAQMLVYFSASTEFLSDVQVTASNPASTQHWLVLF